MYDIKEITEAVKKAVIDFEENRDKVTIGVSQRHVHL